jgi:LysM repeat protein
MRRSAAALALALLLPLPGLAGQVVVKQGETLSDIAARYHVSVDRLLQLNGIKDPKALQVGSRLTVPGAPSSPSRAGGGGGGGGGGATGGSGRGNCTVKSGETISEIADRYGIGANRLLELNGIRDAKGLQVGSRITVPTAGPAKPSRAPGASSPASRGPANYTVKAGETISEIADRYGISANRLLELDDIRDAKGLQVGSRITVPTAGPAETVQSAQRRLRHEPRQPRPGQLHQSKRAKPSPKSPTATTSAPTSCWSSTASAMPRVCRRAAASPCPRSARQNPASRRCCPPSAPPRARP